MTECERRVVTYPQYRSNLGEELFPDKTTDGFFERESRVNFEEMLEAGIPEGGSATVEQLVDFARSYEPRALRDCSPRFRSALELRWQANQSRIIKALIRAHECGLKIVTSKGPSDR